MFRGEVNAQHIEQASQHGGTGPVHPQNENLHVGEMILFVLLAVLAQKPATVALRRCKIKLHVLQPMPVSDQEQENSLHCAPKLKGPMSCSLPDCLLIPAQKPIASAIARLNLHVRHIGRIRWQAYSGAQTRVNRRVTLPERFEKP